MSWADWLLLSLIAGWFLFVLLRPRKKGCLGSCDGCEHWGSCEKKKNNRTFHTYKGENTHGS